MKSIKYIIGLGLIAVLLAVPAAAQEHRSQSFLNVQAVYATNTFNPTNLATAGSVGTNIVGLVWTNNGARFTNDGTYQTRVNPFRDVALWSLRDGSGPWSTGSTNGSITYNPSYATLATTLTAGSGANSAVTFLLTPVYNGNNEATASAEEWTFSFTPTASTTHTFVTNAPLWRWPGAEKLRLRRVLTADTDAGGNVIITDISLNGFVP